MRRGLDGWGGGVDEWMDGWMGGGDMKCSAAPDSKSSAVEGGFLMCQRVSVAAATPVLAGDGAVPQSKGKRLPAPACKGPNRPGAVLVPGVGDW